MKSEKKNRMARAGLISKHDFDARHVAIVGVNPYMRALARKLEDAVRHGIPVDRRPTTTSIIGQATLVERTERSISLARQRLAVAQANARGAAELAAETRTKDPEQSTQFTDLAQQHRAQAATHQAELDALLRATPGTLEDEFDVLAHTWLPAIAQMCHSEGRLTYQERLHLNDILVGRRLFFRDGNWWGRTTLRVSAPEDEHVAEVGPIEFEVPGSGNNSRILTLIAGEQPRLGAGIKSSEVVARLSEGDAMTVAAARTVTNHAFPHVAAILLHRLHGDELPTWVDGQWRSREWQDEVLIPTYTDPNWWWSGHTGRWAVHSPARQAMAHLAAEAPGELDFADVKDRLFLPDRRALLSSLNRGRGTSAAESPLPWVFPFEQLEDPGYGRSSRFLFKALRCRCGKKVSTSLRSPEVARCALCPHCGRMPGAEKVGIDPDLLFPLELSRLAVPLSWCLRHLEEAYEAKRRDLRGSARELLLKTDLLLGGATAKEIAAAMGAENHVRSLIQRLESYGFLTYDPTRGENPRVWCYTYEGREFAEELALTEVRPTRLVEKKRRRDENAAMRAEVRKQVKKELEEAQRKAVGEAERKPPEQPPASTRISFGEVSETSTDSVVDRDFGPDENDPVHAPVEARPGLDGSNGADVR